MIFLFVRKFFEAEEYWSNPEADGVVINPLTNLKNGTSYSKKEILTIFGYYNAEGKAIGQAYETQTLGFYDDGKDDLLERAYIWNTTAFKISDDAVFVVDQNGNRYIENFAIVPHSNRELENDNRDEESKKYGVENFDFDGGFFSEIVNSYLRKNIDPSGIGKTVEIIFTGEREAEKQHFTYDDYLVDRNRKSHFSLIAGGRVAHETLSGKIVKRLWDSGSIQHLYQGKPIIYGTNGDDNIQKTIAKNVDLLGTVKYDDFSGEAIEIKDHPLSKYVENGIVYVTGDGDDTIIGTQYDDILHGGKGDDTLEGGEGHDIYYIGGKDTVIDSDGKGEIRFLDKDYRIKPRENDDNSDEPNVLIGWITSFSLSDDSAVFEGSGTDGEIYRFEAKGFEYSESKASPMLAYIETLVITELSTGHQVTIKDFENGQLNIHLADIIPVEGPWGIDNSQYYPSGDMDYKNDWGGENHVNTRAEGSDLDSPSENDSGNNNGNNNSGSGNSGGRNSGGSNGSTGGSPNNPGRNYAVYDPLVLDLDGDGIETVAFNGREGALFDHDGNGIRTATGWLSADDGFLVLDRNGDGVINHTGELFGDNILLSDGSKSAHGFAALTDLDENKDGVIDRNDPLFSELKIWRDLNQNGISERNELFSLESLGIKSLHTGYEDRFDEMAGNNLLTQLGKYEKQDGSFGEMGDVNFSFNPFYSRFSDELNLTDEQKRLINLTGIGRVRDLREAAALSDELTRLLQDYAMANSRETQLELLPAILDNWAATDQSYRPYDKSLEKTTETAEAEIIRVTPNQLKQLRNAEHDPTVMERFEQNKAKIATLNSLYGLNIDRLYYTTDNDIDYITDKINRMYQDTIETAYRSLLLQTFRLRKYVYGAGIKQPKDGKQEADYSRTLRLFQAEFKKSPLNALTDLAEYISLLKTPTEWPEGLLLLGEYIQYAKSQGLYEQWQSQSPRLIEELNAQGLVFIEQGTAEGKENSDILIGSTQDDILNGKAGGDILIGGAGNDVLKGGLGSDTYIFSKGHGQDIVQEEYDWRNSNDKDVIRFTDVNYDEVKFRRTENDLVLFGYHQDDSVTIKNFYAHRYYEVEVFEFADRTLTLKKMREEGFRLYGTDGDDVIDSGDSNDILIGGAGNDVLKGGLGSDTYIFGENHGHDVIQENSRWNDKHTDTIRFTDLDDPNRLWFSRKDNDLLIRDLDNFDSVRVQNWYRHKDYKVEQIKLANEQALDIASVEKLVQAMAVFDAAHSGDITLAPKEEVRQYMDKLAVVNYWG